MMRYHLCPVFAPTYVAHSSVFLFLACRVRISFLTAFFSDITSSSVLTPRVVGIALARYDFGSRDTRELSLQVGDLVKIYIKCANGWWKGEVNGRVSTNPSICYSNVLINQVNVSFTISQSLFV